jgi:hypothetical protein
MALKGLKTAELGCLEVKPRPVGHFHPGHNPHDVIEIHIPPRSETMHNLLNPGGATFGEGRNEEVARLGLVGQTACRTFSQLGTEKLCPRLPFLPGSGPGEGLAGGHQIFSLRLVVI